MKFITFIIIILSLSACAVNTKTRQYTSAERSWNNYLDGKFLTTQQQKDLVYGQG